MKTYTNKEIIKRYNEYYNENVKKFRYEDESELEEIIIEIFDLSENSIIEFDYENEKVLVLN